MVKMVRHLSPKLLSYWSQNFRSNIRIGIQFSSPIATLKPCWEHLFRRTQPQKSLLRLVHCVRKSFYLAEIESERLSTGR